MLFLHRLMTIYISTTRCFGCIAGDWNFQVQNIFLYNRWIRLQHLLYIKFGVWHWLWRGPVFFTIQLNPYSVTFGLSSDLLIIYSSCSCTWSLPYSYWKSSVTCAFFQKILFRKLKSILLIIVFTYDLAFSLLLFKIVIGGGFRCI